MKEKPTDGARAAWLYAESPAKAKYDARLVGKWQMFVPPDHIDAACKAIEHRIQAGELGISGKVSTGGLRPHAKDDSYVIIVYAADWRDLDDLRRMLRVIRNAGFTSRIYFKRDVESLAGEYTTPFAFGDDRATGALSPRPNIRKVVSIWGSPEADVIQTKWVDGKTWTVVTDANVAQVISLISQQDAEMGR